MHVWALEEKYDSRQKRGKLNDSVLLLPWDLVAKTSE
jgi:hypothetical protein